MQSYLASNKTAIPKLRSASRVTLVLGYDFPHNVPRTRHNDVNSLPVENQRLNGPRPNEASVRRGSCNEGGHCGLSIRRRDTETTDSDQTLRHSHVCEKQGVFQKVADTQYKRSGE